MSSYINTETNQYPVFQGDIRLVTGMHDGEFVLVAPFSEVLQVPMPVATNKMQRVVEVHPVFVDGVWTQKWELQYRSDSEQAGFEAHLLSLNNTGAKKTKATKPIPVTTL